MFLFNFLLLFVSLLCHTNHTTNEFIFVLLAENEISYVCQMLSFQTNIASEL